MHPHGGLPRSARAARSLGPSRDLSLEDQCPLSERLARLAPRKSQQSGQYRIDLEAQRPAPRSCPRRWGEQDSLADLVRTYYDEVSNVVRVDRHEQVRDPGTGALLREDVFSRLFTYDLLDRRSSTTDGLGNRTGFTYDSRNNVVSATDSLGNAKRWARTARCSGSAVHCETTASSFASFWAGESLR